MNQTAYSREINARLARGWNTWDVRSVTAHVLLPQRLRVHISFAVPSLCGWTEQCVWGQVEDFGEHAADGRYTAVDIVCCGGRWRVESTARDARLYLRVTPLCPPPEGAYVAAELTGIWGAVWETGRENDRLYARREGETFLLSAGSAPVQPAWDPLLGAHLCLPGDAPVYFTVGEPVSPRRTDELLEEGLRSWLGETVTAAGGLGQGLDAMRRSLLWNMVYEHRTGRVVTPVSRAWCQTRGRTFGDYVLFDWDTFFAALQYGLISRDLAFAAFFSILEEETPEGMIPNFGCGVGQSRDRSEPQVGALCAMKLFAQFGDLRFLEAVFQPLLRWNRWRFRERDRNGDGLLELASTPFPGWESWQAADSEVCTKQAALYESGLDNSTMFDRAVFDPEQHCLRQSYAGLNGLMLADCLLLERMALLLHRPEEAAELRSRYEALRTRVNETLWNEESGIYLNRSWDGVFDPTLSLTHFYPMLGGAPDERQQRKLMAHLLDENEFWGDFVVPNIARCDPSFPQQNYWRGRIWAPTNFLVGQSLLKAGELQAWDELTEKGLRMFLRCWNSRGVVGENYNAITGEAAERGNSDRFYHWGALFVYMAVERLVDFDPWTGELRRRAPCAWAEGVRNIPVGDTRESFGQDA